MSTFKSVMIINHQAPHASIDAWEALDLALTLAAFDQQVFVVYLDDGVYQLLKNQDTTKLGIKNCSRATGAFSDHDINDVYVLKRDLDDRKITVEELTINVTTLQTRELKDIMQGQDFIIHF